MRNPVRLAAIAVVLLLCATALGQGLYTESNTIVTANGNQTFAGQSYFMPKMMKTVTGAQAIIIRLDKEMIYRVNNDEKTYSVMTFAEWEAQMKKASSEMDSKMEELKKQMANMPPEQRKMMEQIMSNQMAGKDKAQPNIEVKNAGETKTILGYTATKYVVMKDGKEFLTAWITKDIKGFAGMRKDYEEMTSRLAASAPGGAAAMIEAMKKIEGYPLAMDMAMGVKTEVTKVETRTIPAGEFDVPTGYTKVSADLQGNKMN